MEELHFPDRKSVLIRSLSNDGIIWYETRVRLNPADKFDDSYGNYTIVGYDRTKKQWTRPLLLKQETRDTTLVYSTANGGIYIFDNQSTGSVFQYIAIANVWKPVADPVDTLLPRAVSAKIIGVDTEGVFALSANKILIYDRQNKVWSTVLLPQSTWQEYENDFKTAVTKNAVWLGSDRGLWRLDRVRHTWKEIDYPVSLDPLSDKSEQINPVSAASATTQTIPKDAVLTVDAVDKYSVWGSVSPWGGDAPLVFRFDKQTQRFTVYDPSAGLPALSAPLKLRSDGDSVWVTRGDDTYYLNRLSGRFEKYFHDQPFYSVVVSDKLPAPLHTGNVGTIQTDMVAPDTEYVLLNSIRHLNVDQPTFLYRFHKSSNSLEPLPMDIHFFYDASIADPLFRTHMPSYDHQPRAIGMGGLYIDKEHLWVGTTLGLFWVDRQTGQWSPAKLPAGMPSLIEADDIYANAEGDLWISDSHSTIRLAKQPATTAANP